MKKIASFLAVTMAVVIALAFAGCSSGGSSSAASGSGSASSASASAASSSAASSSASSASASATSSSAASDSAASGAASLAPGVYTATFKTDSSMFHVNEALDNKGTLTVADDGTMTIHVTLAGKGILNLYCGLAADAENDADNLLKPTTDTVTYSDGATEEAYGFDIPVPAIGEEFDVALVGTKGTWYDHKVSVTDPVAQ